MKKYVFLSFKSEKDCVQICLCAILVSYHRYGEPEKWAGIFQKQEKHIWIWKQIISFLYSSTFCEGFLLLAYYNTYLVCCHAL